MSVAYTLKCVCDASAYIMYNLDTYNIIFVVYENIIGRW